MSTTDIVPAIQVDPLIYSAGWDGFLNKVFHETKLAMLDSACSHSCQSVLEWAKEQCDIFFMKRRIEVEQMAEAWCSDDLRSAADAVMPRRKLEKCIREDIENGSNP